MKPNRIRNFLIYLTSVLIFSSGNAYASAGTSAGLSLTESPGAAPAALGEAYTSVRDDIDAFTYNPGSLATLTTGETSFLYYKGLTSDSYGHVAIGSPTKKGGIGFSLGYYNGGRFDMVNDLGQERSVTAKTDLSAALGYAMNFNKVSVGGAVKYFSSELFETSKAKAYMIDAGAQMKATPRIKVGAALRNIGTSLNYVTESNPLPRIASIGVSSLLYKAAFSVNLLADIPYYMNDKQLRPGLGIQFGTGPLAFRIGYKGGEGQQNLSFGAGFLLGKMSFDYAYGLAKDVNATQRASLSLRFGGEKNEPLIAESSDKRENSIVNSMKNKQQDAMVKSLGNMVYAIRPGESLDSIARLMYGDTCAREKIYEANKHLISNSGALEVGQRIVLP